MKKNVKNWHPIKTIPLDRAVLAWMPPLGKSFDSYPAVIRFYLHGFCDCGSGKPISEHWKPTHWMELPECPEQ